LNRGGRPARHEPRGETAERGQHQTFGQRLREQTAPAHAERDADRDLAATTESAREHEVGDVRAGDEQHDRRDTGEPERRSRFERRIGTAAGAHR
jgi:hypothetical protein